MFSESLTRNTGLSSKFARCRYTGSRPTGFARDGTGIDHSERQTSGFCLFARELAKGRLRQQYRAKAVTAVIDLSRLTVNGSMAGRAEGDQVLFGVVARVAAKLLVVDFQVRHHAARLTPPAIATQDQLPKTLIWRSI